MVFKKLKTVQQKMILINGESKAHIEISDRGFQYGDGLFETIEVKDRQPVFFERHLQRLNSGCQRLGIPCPDAQILGHEARVLCRTEAVPARGVLKVIITRGSGGRGYRQPDVIQATRVVSLHPHPNYPEHYSNEGIVARFCATRLGLNPSLAGIKHLNRLEQVLARAEWNDPAIQEGLMLDVNGHVIEGTMSNLFYTENNRLYTAALTGTGVAGILRGLIMVIAAALGLVVIEHDFSKEALLSADEVFVCNSVIGIWPVKRIATTHFAVGQITRSLQVRLQQLINDDCRAMQQAGADRVDNAQ